MTDQDLENELKELRQQVATLSAAREQAAKEASEPEPQPSKSQPQRRSTFDEQLEELYELLEEQIRDIPTLTAIGIFALGVLLGRLMPR